MSTYSLSSALSSTAGKKERNPVQTVKGTGV